MLLPDSYSPVIGYGSNLAEGLPPLQTNFTANLQEVQVRTYLNRGLELQSTIEISFPPRLWIRYCAKLSLQMVGTDR